MMNYSAPVALLEIAGAIAYELTTMVVIDMPTARAAVDAAIARAVTPGSTKGQALGVVILETSNLRMAIRAAAVRAGLLHDATATLTDAQLVALLRNVADLAYYARAHSK